MEYRLPVIGQVHSCFTEKFGIPRQPGLAPAAQGIIEIFPPYNQSCAFEGLAHSSHLWLQFVFHQSPSPEWKPKIKAPRLGGNKTCGVFACRSPLRPAPIGLSAVQLIKIDTRKGVHLHIAGHDLLNGTPILDIKPYIPYTDCLPQATNPFAPAPPPIMRVTWQAGLREYTTRFHHHHPQFAELVEQLLQQNPIPAYHSPTPEKSYGMTLWNLNIRWRYLTNTTINGVADTYLEVVAIDELA